MYFMYYSCSKSKHHNIRFNNMFIENISMYNFLDGSLMHFAHSDII